MQLAGDAERQRMYCYSVCETAHRSKTIAVSISSKDSIFDLIERLCHRALYVHGHIFKSRKEKNSSSTH
jgi:hypothetical protein